MTEKTKTNQEEQVLERRKNAMVFNQLAFAKLVVNELKTTQSGRQVLKKYKQSEVREFIENYQNPKNQEKLREISKTLYVKSLQYQRVIQHFAKMALFPTVIKPIKSLPNEKKALKQYVDIAELLEILNLKHEMQKVMTTVFTEDVFYGYLHRKDKNSFYIQPMNADMCKITHIEDGVYNYSIDMLFVQKNEKYLKSYPEEVQTKYANWKTVSDKDKKSKNTKAEDWNWVELDGKNTICIKANEGSLDIFPPLAGCFDSIFDIEGFKQLRKDREELDNYMLLAQELPIRKDTEDNNDFAIDEQWMNFFHKMLVDALPDNVGAVTSPMPITPITFNKDRQVSDGVAQAERDFWNVIGVSNLLFNADQSTSQGLSMSNKTDEEIVFCILDQIQRWLNRYLKSQYSDLMFNVEILHVTELNLKEKFDIMLQAGQYGFPVKSRIASIIGVSPIEMLEGLKLENEWLKLDKKMIPLVSSHTQTAENNGKSGRPQSDAKDLGDEGSRSRDKVN